MARAACVVSYSPSMLHVAPQLPIQSTLILTVHRGRLGAMPCRHPAHPTPPANLPVGLPTAPPAAGPDENAAHCTTLNGTTIDCNPRSTLVDGACLDCGEPRRERLVPLNRREFFEPEGRGGENLSMVLMTRMATDRPGCAVLRLAAILLAGWLACSTPV